MSGKPKGRLPSFVMGLLFKRHFEQLPNAVREEIYFRRFGPEARLSPLPQRSPRGRR